MSSIPLTTFDRWPKPAVLLAAPIPPLLAGIALGIIGEPMSHINNMVGWVAFSLAKASCVGFCIWLTWRAALVPVSRAKLMLYSVWFIPICLSHEVIVERVSLFLQTGLPEAFDLRISLHGVDNAESDFQSGYFNFISLVTTLSLLRWSTGITLERNTDHSKKSYRVTIHSILVTTFFIALTIAVAGSTIKMNATVLAESGLRNSSFHWMDILDIVTPTMTGISIAFAAYLLATISIQRPCHGIAIVTFAFLILLLPDTLQRFLFTWTGFAPSGKSVVPSIYNCAGAISMLGTCAGCLYVLRISNIEYLYARETSQ